MRVFILLSLIAGVCLGDATVNLRTFLKGKVNSTIQISETVGSEDEVEIFDRDAFFNRTSNTHAEFYLSAPLRESSADDEDADDGPRPLGSSFAEVVKNIASKRTEPTLYFTFEEEDGNSGALHYLGKKVFTFNLRIVRAVAVGSGLTIDGKHRWTISLTNGKLSVAVSPVGASGKTVFITAEKTEVPQSLMERFGGTAGMLVIFIVVKLFLANIKQKQQRAAAERALKARIGANKSS